MSKIKNLFLNISEDIRKTYSKFPITIIAIYILTISVLIELNSIMPADVAIQIYTIMALSIIGILFTETLTKDNYVKAVGTCISFSIGVLFNSVLKNNGNDFFNRLATAYVMILPLLSIYLMSKKQNIKFEEYVIKSFSNLCKNFLIYIILNIGISIVMSIFIALILDGNHFKILIKVLGGILGFYYIPSIINSFSNMDTEVGKFIKGLITYVFTPLVSIMIGIIYIYIIKISISGELIKKSIFFILSLIFVSAFPVIVMLKNYEDNKMIKKVINIISYSYIPFIFLQIYSMNTRVGEYALTESRYIGYMLIIFEIFFIILLILKNSKYLNKSILVMAILIFVGTVSPLNVKEVPYKSQSNRFKKIYGNTQKFDELSEKDKKECYQIYRYLERNDKEEYVRISKEEKEKILSYDQYSKRSNNNYNEIYCKNEIDGFDISEYKTIYKLEDFYKYDGFNKEENIILKNYNQNINVSVNLKEYIEKMIEYNENNAEKMGEYDNNYKDINNRFKENNILETQDTSISIYLTKFSFRYNTVTKEITYISLSGYLLKK
ncbi:MAG: DUF4153 domain-containing protein [Clostridia bacterium]|nr:DUF4153 domain-containing protein [Clostridia bacterium]